MYVIINMFFLNMPMMYVYINFYYILENLDIVKEHLKSRGQLNDSSEGSSSHPKKGIYVHTKR